jgi:hypothetical protein
VYVVAGIALVALVLASLALAVVLDEDSTTGTESSGAPTSETRELPPFTEVDLAGANTVTIGIGGTQRVVVRGAENVLPLVTTEVEDGTLVIAQSESFDTASRLSVEVVVPSLDAVRLTGAGTVTVDGHDFDRLAVSLTGAGTIRGSGAAHQLEVELGGVGDVEFGELVASTVTVALSGSGNVHVRATGRLDAHVSGTGSVFYGGDPASVTQEVTGTGVIVEE